MIGQNYQKLLLFVLSAAIALALSACSQKPEDKAQPETTISLEVMPAKTATITEEKVMTGTIESRKHVILTSRIPGHIREIFVREGDSVISGQLLISLENDDLKEKVNSALAQLEQSREALKAAAHDESRAGKQKEAAKAKAILARSTYKRFQQMLAEDSVSVQENEEKKADFESAEAELDAADESVLAQKASLEAAKANVAKAEANLAQARTELSYASLKSPLSGLVTRKCVQEGDLAEPGKDLLDIEQKNYRLEVPVDEAIEKTISLGQKIEVFIEPANGIALTATVDEIAPAADPQTRTFLIKLSMPASGALKSGAFGRALFHSVERKAMLIPSSAVKEKGQLQMVYVIGKDNRARMRLVKTGKDEGNKTEVLSGLNEGEIIAVSNMDMLSDGQKVSVISGGK